MNTFNHPPLLGSVGEIAEDLYFAYGSNMRLQQMFERCPSSALFAKGILRKYKFQINSRGGGNVVEGNSEDRVEGIIFTVSHDDVRALRHFEGIGQHFFVEKRLKVEAVPFHDTRLACRKTKEAAGLLAQHQYHYEPGLSTSRSSPNVSITSLDQKQPRQTNNDEQMQASRGWSIPPNQKSPPDSAQWGDPDKPSHDLPRLKKLESMVYDALIYVCREQQQHHQPPGEIRGEYQARMRLAMADAQVLGVSGEYLDTSLHPLVFSGGPSGNLSIPDHVQIERPRTAISAQDQPRDLTDA